eukprot:4707664-Amphidinium_carterae.1
MRRHMKSISWRQGEGVCEIDAVFKKALYHQCMPSTTEAVQTKNKVRPNVENSNRFSVTDPGL